MALLLYLSTKDIHGTKLAKQKKGWQKVPKPFHWELEQKTVFFMVASLTLLVVYKTLVLYFKKSK